MDIWWSALKEGKYNIILCFFFQGASSKMSILCNVLNCLVDCFVDCLVVVLGLSCDCLVDCSTGGDVRAGSREGCGKRGPLPRRSPASRPHWKASLKVGWSCGGEAPARMQVHGHIGLFLAKRVERQPWRWDCRWTIKRKGF